MTNLVSNMSYSSQGHQGGLAVSPEVTGPATDGLERSCRILADGIRTGPTALGIERIEASFRGNGFAPHRHDTYALGLTLSGVQTFHYRGESRFSQPGNIIVLHPDELHDGAAGTEDGLRYRMLYVAPELIRQAGGETDVSLPFVATPVFSDPDFARALGEALTDIEANPDALVFDDVLARIAAGLQRHAGMPAQRFAASARTAVDRATVYLREHSERTVTSQDLEAVTGLDRYTLARQFRRLTGTSPHRYLVMRRLESARGAMLSGVPLAEAAMEAGFADQSHFTRHFKKSYGLTPGRWLELIRA